MSGICSLHFIKYPNCNLCNTEPQDVFPDWDLKVAEAKSAGEYECLHCGYIYYKTVDFCPSCNTKR